MGTTVPAPFLAICLLATALVVALADPLPESPGSDPFQKPLQKPLQISPDESVVPANHLKFYFHFAQPMERNEVFRYLRLVEVDEKGDEVAEVPEPFREVELWDETFTRMTLWFHPGRQKPGVNLNLELGPILEEGKSYRLELSAAWKSESGETIAPDGFHHYFSAGPADNDCPSPEQWRVTLSPTGEEIKIDPGEALDPVSIGKRITLVNPFEPGTTVPCAFAFESRFISLRPGQPLAPGDYQLVIDPRLEDLAGNSIARPFTLDLEQQPGFKERTDPVILPFSIP